MFKIYLKNILCVCLMIIILAGAGFTVPVKAETTYIDNSDLMPEYVTDDKVTLIDGAPDWISSMCMLQCRVSHATKEGTLKAAVKVLDHCREMGVNALWICPVAESGDPLNNTYSNLGPHTIDPTITGTKDYTKGWKELKNFIDEAHKRDVRIILDMVTWGTSYASPLIKEHPDWFDGEDFGGAAFDWENEEFKEWYIQQLVEIAVKTGCDGFRMDCEPRYAGYDVNREIYERLLKRGRKVLMMSEDTNVRNGAFHLDQTGVKDASMTMTEIYRSTENTFIDNYNIVDSIKTGANIGDENLQAVGLGGTFRYYANALTVHDSKVDRINGNKLAIGYQAIYAPFIPIWALSQEWMDELNGVLYFTHKPDWDAMSKKENREFYESVKQMIRIRRTYSDIFEYWPENHQETNICEVDVAGNESLQAYARYKDDTSILIIPNNNVQNVNKKFTVYLPFEEMDLMYYKNYTISDALTGEKIISGSMSKVRKFLLEVPQGDMRTLVVKGSGKYTPSDDTMTEENEDDTASETDKNSSSKKKVVKRVVTYSYLPTFAIVLIIVGAVLIVGGIVVAIIFIRKKKRKTKADS